MIYLTELIRRQVKMFYKNIRKVYHTKKIMSYSFECSIYLQYVAERKAAKTPATEKVIELLCKVMEASCSITLWIFPIGLTTRNVILIVFIGVFNTWSQFKIPICFEDISYTLSSLETLQVLELEIVCHYCIIDVYEREVFERFFQRIMDSTEPWKSTLCWKNIWHHSNGINDNPCFARSFQHDISWDLYQEL